MDAIRNESFLTSDNNKSFVTLTTPRPHVPARVVILPRKSLQSPLRPPVIPCHTMASNPRLTIPSHTMASNPRLTIPLTPWPVILASQSPLTPWPVILALQPPLTLTPCPIHSILSPPLAPQKCTICLPGFLKTWNDPLEMKAMKRMTNDVFSYTLKHLTFILFIMIHFQCVVPSFEKCIWMTGFQMTAISLLFIHLLIDIRNLSSPHNFTYLRKLLRCSTNPNFISIF